MVNRAENAAESSQGSIITIDPDRHDLLETVSKLFSGLSIPFRKQDPTQTLSTFTIKDISKSKKRRIGGGGFGDVYRLSHPQMGEIVLKQLRLSRSTATAEDQRRVRLPPPLDSVN